MRKLHDYEIERFRSVLVGLDILTNYESNQETFNDLVHKYVKSITDYSLKYQSTNVFLFYLVFSFKLIDF
jgi:hypothetical protein